MNPHSFAYEHLFRHMKPTDMRPETAVRNAVGAAYPIAGKPGVVMRLGGVGPDLHMALIKESGSILKGDFDLDLPAPHRMISPKEKSQAFFRSEIALDPPDEPYMVIIFDKSFDYISKLKLSSRDVLVENCPTMRIYDLYQMRTLMAAATPQTLMRLFEYKKLFEARRVGLKPPAFYTKALEKNEPTTEDEWALYRSLPPVGSNEFDMIRLAFNVDRVRTRAKEAVSVG